MSTSIIPKIDKNYGEKLLAGVKSTGIRDAQFEDYWNYIQQNPAIKAAEYARLSNLFRSA